MTAATPVIPGYRTPRLSPRPARRPARAVPVRLDRTVIGALHFYRRAPGSWTDEQVALGERPAGTTADPVVRPAAKPRTGDPGRP